MITRALVTYADTRWKSHQKAVSILSADKNSGQSCVKSDTLMYDLDEIVGEHYRGDKKPRSADALYIQNVKNIWLIEFKQGLNYSLIRSSSPDISDEERRYREKEREELKLSIRLKAIESYLFLEKKVLASSEIPPCDKKANLMYLAVVDLDPVSAQVDMLTSLATPTAPSPQPEQLPTVKELINSLRASLKRLHGHKDAQGVDYLYDQTNAISCTEFCTYLSLEET